jgi:hypothetical protein
MNTIDRIRRRDPGDVSDDSIDDACGFIAYAAKCATAAMSGTTIDDECTADELGDFVRFSMPAIQVTVKRVTDPDLMATWAAAKWLEAVEAARGRLRVS